MNQQTIMLALVAALGSIVVAMTTLNILPAIYADKGGDPNNDPVAQLLAEEREDDFDEKRAKILADDNFNNDEALERALEAMDDDRGVEGSD